jgi:hypothetical protein
LPGFLENRLPLTTDPGNILITQPVYEDIHPNLITVPLQTGASMPYGLIYAKELTAAAAKFIHAVQKIKK